MRCGCKLWIPSFIAVLTYNQAGGSSNYTSEVTLCQGKSGYSFCCGETNECCTEDNEFTLKPTLVTIGAAATSNATTAPSNDDHTGSSKNVAIGVGVGVPLGVIAMAMLGVGFWWGRKNTSAKYRALQNDSWAHTPVSHVPHADSQPVHEIDTHDSGRKRSELPVD